VKVHKFTQFNVWPVVQRELREGARRPVNHRLRFLSAGVGTVLLWIIVANSDRPAVQMGGWLLGGLHTLLLGLILLIVPALTADCIARERREGTLGLLFLTPLSAGGIVAGKALAQALRALTLWLAVLPILAIPFMTGGITWFDAFIALSLEFCAAVLCLAAGLLASTLAQERNAAFVLAFLFGIIFLLLFSQVFLFILIGAWRGFARSAPGGVAWWRWQVGAMPFFSGLFDTRGGAGWSSIATFSPALSKIWTWLCWSSPPVVLLIFYMVARFAARRVKRSWQDKIPSPRRENLIRLYCAPLFRRRFQRNMQRTLDWNPIAWLQQYSWKARLSKWGLALLFALIECAIFHASPDSDSALALALVPLLLILGGIYTFVGVNGFLEEKRSGALELLLITPISVNKLIFGRVWGLWKQFLPAGLILAGFYVDRQWYMYKIEAREDLFLSAQLEFILACGFLSLPVFATYFALRVKNLIVAAVLTWIALCLPAAFAAEFIQLFTGSDQIETWWMPPMALLSYGAFALLTCFLLRHSLSRRIYSF
jgi:ABC-type Na+ efflux pump permease subunit